MSVPTYDQFIEPLLRFLFEHPVGISTKDIYESVAERLDLSDLDRAEMLPSRSQATYKNRIGWAHDRLKRAGFSSSPKRGYWKITAEGINLIQTYPDCFPDEVITQVAKNFDSVSLKSMDGGHSVSAVNPMLVDSPDDRLELALAELKDTVTSELLDLLLQTSPTFFELVVLDLLHAMGYGTNRSDLQHVGKSADGGIDGIISLDRLGLEKVYIQAKRWQNTVGRPEIQAFYGALAGQKAKKGVFMTTSTFSQHAVQFSQTVEGIILIDGQKLATLMSEYGVGVTQTVVKIPKIDSDYFES